MADAITPGPDYDAALWGAAVGIRRERRFLGVTGKAPGDMLNGLLTNSLPLPFGEEERGMVRGSVVYSALLTPKGKMITDLRSFRDPTDGFVLDLPGVGAEEAMAHFKKFLPPRLAKVEDRSGELALMTLLGPEAPALLAEVASRMGLPGTVEEMVDLVEGEEILVPSRGSEPFRVTRNGESHAAGWDLLLSWPSAEELRDRLDSVGAIPLTEASLEILRVEKGRPAFGKDMKQDTIPTEAGIQRRAIDHQKGCYTGQEVIIRIRDRGHVNKELRGFLLGETSPPASGHELFKPGREKSVGWITSAVVSPAFSQTIALGYLQRGVELAEEVRLGSVDGPQVQACALSDEGWVLD
ncbi:MAG: glycine cleavage T C-terminal barrel domain-containing protein [Gemmatimonadota bacterium]